MGRKREKKSNAKKLANAKIVADSGPLELDDGYLISTKDDQCAEERRFIWKPVYRTNEFDTPGFDTPSDHWHDDHIFLAKNQVNFSATKYIKP